MAKGRFSSRALRNMRRSSRPVGNASTPPTRNPMRRDPTRSIMLRLRFMRELRAGYARLRAEIVRLIEDEDALGLRRPDAPDVAPVTPIWVVGNEGGSFFADCDRDEKGHCKPGEGGGSSGKAERSAAERSKADTSPGGKGTSGTSDHEAKAKEGEEKAKGLIGKWLGKVSALVDKTPGLGHAKRAVGATMGAIHEKLAQRYGDKAATVIMTSGSLGGYPVMFAALATIGFTLPVVTDLVSIAAHTLVAEAMLQLGIIKGGKKPTANELLDYLEGLLLGNASDFFSECERDDKGHCEAGEGPSSKPLTKDQHQEVESIARKATEDLAEHPDLSFAHGKLEQYQWGTSVHKETMLDELARGYFDPGGKYGQSWLPENMSEKVRDHFEPVRQAIREKVGDHITLYRGADAVGGVPGKKLSSYAADKAVAQKFIKGWDSQGNPKPKVMKEVSVPVDAIYMVSRTPDRPLEFHIDNDKLPKHLSTNAEDSPDLPPPATLSQEANRAWVAIAMSFAAAVAEHKDKIEGRLEHEGELLLEAKKHFDKEGRPGDEGETTKPKPTANAVPVERVYEALAQEFAGTGDALDHGQCGAVARALELANPAFKPYALTTHDPYGSTSGGRKITHLLVSADGGKTFLDGRGRRTKAQVLAGVDQEDGPELVPARYTPEPGTVDGGHYTAEGTLEKFQAGPHPRVLAMTGITRTGTSCTGNARLVANAPQAPTAPRWQYEDNARKVERFRAWLRERMGTHLAGDALIEEYIARGYKKGQGRGFDDSKKVKAGQGGAAALGVSKDDYLRQQQFMQPTVAKVKLLAGRAYSELEGVNQRMGAVMGRILADGLVQGKAPNKIAEDLTRELGLAKSRAEAIANTEIVRAHAEGQLDALEDMGVSEVEASVEWDTADNPCPMCRPMSGSVFSVEQARGMLPRHPHCKCAWKPAGADTVAKAASSPQGTKAARAKAAGQSVRAETGQRSNKKAADSSRWVGADLVGNVDPLTAELDIILGEVTDDGYGEA